MRVFRGADGGYELGEVPTMKMWVGVERPDGGEIPGA